MNVVEICKRNELISLVRKVAKLWNEKDEEFWKACMEEILKQDLTKAMECFTDLLRQAEWLWEGFSKNDTDYRL